MWVYENIKQVKPTRPCFIDNVVIKKVEQAKYLGIIIDQKLNWQEHINRRETLCMVSCKETWEVVQLLWIHIFIKPIYDQS